MEDRQQMTDDGPDVVEYDPEKDFGTYALDMQVACTRFAKAMNRLCYHEQRLGEVLENMDPEIKEAI